MKGYRDVIAKVFTPIMDGDEVIAQYEPGEQVRFFCDVAEIGEIADARFAAVFGA